VTGEVAAVKKASAKLRLRKPKLGTGNKGPQNLRRRLANRRRVPRLGKNKTLTDFAHKKAGFEPAFLLVREHENRAAHFVMPLSPILVRPA
jgi:hypothetical protein